MKKIISILAIFLLIFCIILNTGIYAKEMNDTDLGTKAKVQGYGTSKDLQVNNDGNFELNIYSIESNDMITISQCSIHDIGDSILSIRANTQTQSSVDSLRLDVYLEKWNGKQWSEVSSWSKTEYYDDEVNFEKGYIGESKCNYRIRTIHMVSDGDEEETDTTKTSYITLQ